MIRLSLLWACLLAVASYAWADDLSVNQIIQRFAAKEREFKQAWMNYTYKQRAEIEVLSVNGIPTNERMVIESEVIFNDKGKREVKITAEKGRLRSVRITPEDIEVIHNLQPFVLTSDDLVDYNIYYLGKERVDEIDTYVFQVEPKRAKKGRLYFKGRIWVDDRDFQIVRTLGKPVPEMRHNKFPEFETLREMIDGKYWFPTWTGGEDTLNFGGEFLVRIRHIVTYRDYKKFEVGTQIRYGPPVKP